MIGATSGLQLNACFEMEEGVEKGTRIGAENTGDMKVERSIMMRCTTSTPAARCYNPSLSKSPALISAFCEHSLFTHQVTLHVAVLTIDSTVDVSCRLS